MASCKVICSKWQSYICEIHHSNSNPHNHCKRYIDSKAYTAQVSCAPFQVSPHLSNVTNRTLNSAHQFQLRLGKLNIQIYSCNVLIRQKFKESDKTALCVFLCHKKLTKFHPRTLQLNLIFRTLYQNRTDRVQVVIVTAAKRTSPGFCYLVSKGTENHLLCYTEQALQNTGTVRQQSLFLEIKMAQNDTFTEV